MKEQLGAEYDAFLECSLAPHNRGVRINTLKLSADRAMSLGLVLSPAPFSPFGYYVEDDDTRIGRSVWHHCGAIYSQEPSAMSAVTALAPCPCDTILDMCAAPGGKSTQIAQMLCGEGLLWSNEVVRSRAQILISNIERMGISNAVVSSLRPELFTRYASGYFDKVLVDAPCSGEGMFRRDARAIQEWSPEHSDACAVRQRAILDSAGQCVREGGVLVYSTCTFSPEENELTVVDFLTRHPEFSLDTIDAEFGRQGLNLSNTVDLTRTRRIYPMDGGEGHFVARMIKGMSEQPSDFSGAVGVMSGADSDVETAKLLNDCFTALPSGRTERHGDCVYLLPKGYRRIDGLPPIRAGVLIGEVKKNRIEPMHPLFMCAKPSDCRRAIRLAHDDERLQRFLRGEELEAPECSGGYTAVCCEEVVTGFGKCSGGVLKNRYPKGLRLL